MTPHGPRTSYFRFEGRQGTRSRPDRDGEYVFLVGDKDPGPGNSGTEVRRSDGMGREGSHVHV